MDLQNVDLPEPAGPVQPRGVLAWERAPLVIDTTVLFTIYRRRERRSAYVAGREREMTGD